ncbi:MAG: sigma-70 family RNA polymerase sigma factor [Saccharofermentans sp.]|nr:sigma-70 family RNA polymerase sigma factor [Saccharofermentans sp.]
MEDNQIVELYWQRDENAILETQTKYERYLTKVANNILNNVEDSMESVNDTYLNAWNSMPPHRPEMLSTFLAKITRRLSIDIFRKRTADKRGGTEYELSLQELQESGFEAGVDSEVVDENESKLLGEAINKYLRTLPEESRNIFIGRYFHNDSIKDVCNYYGYSETKVKSLLFRIRNGLRDYLEKEGFEG